MMAVMRFALAVLLAFAATPALAQEAPAPSASDSASVKVAPAPVDPAKRAAEELDKLFGELQKDTPRDADGVQQKIWDLWMSNPSPTAEVLLRQSVKARNDGALESAEKILNTLLGANPDFAEAYNKRAALYYLQKRYDEALSDLNEALQLEPRHFGALAGKAMVFYAQGKFGEASLALQDALTINPHDEVAKEALKTIENRTPGI